MRRAPQAPRGLVRRDPLRDGPDLPAAERVRSLRHRRQLRGGPSRRWIRLPPAAQSELARPLRPLHLRRPRAAGKCPFVRRVPPGKGGRAPALALRGGLMRDLLALYDDVVRALDARALARAAPARRPRPAPGGRLGALNQALLSSGAPIEEMNCVRAHLSRLKGGGLARALHAAGVTRARAFVAVDVPIGGVRAVSSGPAIADETTCADALTLARKYGLPPAAPPLRG